VNSETPNLHFHRVTPDRWQDLETLFGPHGADGGCSQDRPIMRYFIEEARTP
jgi:hypothetical protein